MLGVDAREGKKGGARHAEYDGLVMCVRALDREGGICPSIHPSGIRLHLCARTHVFSWYCLSAL